MCVCVWGGGGYRGRMVGATHWGVYRGYMMRSACWGGYQNLKKGQIPHYNIIELVKLAYFVCV